MPIRIPWGIEENTAYIAQKQNAMKRNSQEQERALGKLKLNAKIKH